MPNFFKSAALGIGILVGVAVTAHAQTQVNGQSTMGATPGTNLAVLTPSPHLNGPKTSSENSIGSRYIPSVAPSQDSPSLALGASNAPATQHYQVPADWNSNPAMHPYAPHGGLAPN